MKIETVTMYYYTPVRMAEMLNTIPNAGEDGNE